MAGSEYGYQYLDPEPCVPVTDYGYAATCLTSGLTDGTHCAICKRTLIGRSTIKPTGHTAVNTAGFEPTCTSTGKTAGQYCGVCDAVLVEATEIPALGHKEVVDLAVKATCTENGPDEGQPLLPLHQNPGAAADRPRPGA